MHTKSGFEPDGGASHADVDAAHAAAHLITRREAVSLIIGPTFIGPALIGCAARAANPNVSQTSSADAASGAATQTAQPAQGTSATPGANANAAALRNAIDLQLPMKSGSVRMLVIGDSGTGGRAQQEVADQIAAFREAFPFDFALMLGDNLYGRQRPIDFVRKFERPYKPLLDANVTFHAALGNHDNPRQRFYEPFNMKGQRYYSFKKGPVRFFAMDTTLMDPPQVDWLKRELRESSEHWKICYAHHPLYSSGARHGSEMDLRRVLEPMFVEHGVSVVLAGHDHFYERTTPQQGIQYFVCGGAAKLRRGNIRSTPFKATGFDRDHSFMLVEIAGDELFFQAVSRTGKTVDLGRMPRVRREREARAADVLFGTPALASI